MKHKYNIQRLLMSIVGYQGLPYPGMFFPPRPVGSYTGDEVEIPTSRTQAGTNQGHAPV